MELPEPSQISAALAVQHLPIASLELSPSPVTWSVAEALGDDTTEIDDVEYAPNRAEVAALHAEVHVQTAPDPTLYGGKDKVDASTRDVHAEAPVRIAPPSLLERAAERLDSLAPSSTLEDTVQVKRPKKARKSIFPVVLFGAATGGAILLATLLSPESKGKAVAAAGGAAPLGDMPAGILEVDAKGATVLVDGVPRGRGQRVSVVLPQGRHQVGLEGKPETKEVEVRASEVVRVNLEKAP
jgi:hypothetical protein